MLVHLMRPRQQTPLFMFIALVTTTIAMTILFRIDHATSLFSLVGFMHVHGSIDKAHGHWR